MAAEGLRREFIPALNNFVEVRSEYMHTEGTNDYTKEKLIIEEIMDRSGQRIEPVWGKKWKEVSSGIETMEDEEMRQQRVRISQAACPARVRFQEYYEYGEYEGSGCGVCEDADFSPIQSRYYWVQYESGRRRLIKEALYLGIIVLIAASAIFTRGKHYRRLLRAGLDKVEMVEVVYYGGNYHPGGGATAVFTPAKDKELVFELYDKVISTKLEVHTNPDCTDCQEGDPQFEIIFRYKNGKSDIIESTETGQYIFRRLSWNGWVGGPREDLFAIVKKLHKKKED